MAQYWQTYRAWLLRILNERIYLSKRGYLPCLLNDAIQLKTLVEYHGYRNDQLMAGLIIRKQAVIKRLIPANNGYKKQIERLIEATAQAAHILSVQ